LEGLSGEAGLVVGDNEPYDGALAGDTIDRHATAQGLANALIEIRQDLIASDEGAEEWAGRFARLIAPLAADPALRMPTNRFGTRTRERLRRQGGMR
jgi:predicted N-formylglutamate amidohydrolase